LKKKNHIIFKLLVVAIVFLSSCKTTKQNSNSGSSKQLGLTEQDQVKFSYQFVEGCKERMKGNMEIAENLFKECLKIDPTSAAVKYELGNIYRYNRLYDSAIKYAKECAETDQKNEWYQLLYIDCLHNKRQYSQASDIYLRLIKNYPNRPDFYEGLAGEYMYAGNYEKAYKTYDELEKKFGQNEAFTINKIKLLKQLNKNKEVEVELKKLIQSNPNEARYYTYLAEFYQESNQNEKAMDTYKEILKIDPKNPMVHLALADYYRVNNEPESSYSEIKIAFENPDLEVTTKNKILISYYQISETNTTFKQQANELIQITLKLHSESAETHNINGDFLYRDKKIIEARDEYLKAVELEKGNYANWNQLMLIESETNDYVGLEKHSSEAMELFPNQPAPYFFNGASNIQLKQHQKAVQSLQDGLEFVYNNNALLIQFYLNLGDSYNSLKEFEKSNKAFEDALKIDPDNTYVLNNYAYYLSLRKKDLDKAEKYSKRSNELAPNNRSYMDTYGWILYQQEKYSEAEVWLKKAEKMGNKNSVILEHYGDVLYKLNKKEEALNYWKEAKNAGEGSEFLNKKIIDKILYE
jgi:tetratricopeptide (TPR) repeat protein